MSDDIIKIISECRDILEEKGEKCPVYLSFEKEEYTLTKKEIQEIAKCLYLAEWEINSYHIEKNPIEIKYKDIDPDTGNITSDEIISVCKDLDNAKWVKLSIEENWYGDKGPSDPNREFYINYNKSYGE